MPFRITRTERLILSVIAFILVLGLLALAVL
jgi:hypothetical protein